MAAIHVGARPNGRHDRTDDAAGLYRPRERTRYGSHADRPAEFEQPGGRRVNDRGTDRGRAVAELDQRPQARRRLWHLAAGFRVPSLLDYINAYVALPLDYIDIHIIPITTTPQQNNFIGNSLTVASMAAAAGKPVAISQAWLSKATPSEWDVLSVDAIRAREPFSFWAPLDAYFLQTMQALANYTQMRYVVAEESAYLFAYQTYGGTGANGGAANCTCTTTSCSAYDITQTENSLASAAISLPAFTTTGFSYYSQLVTTPDVIPPSVPANLTGTAGVTGANFSWTASTDNIGVAGYNVYRCTPPGSGQPCAGVWIAETTLPPAGTPPVISFTDSSLTSGTLYNYQVEAFDLVNNHSPLSTTLSLQTFRT